MSIVATLISAASPGSFPTAVRDLSLRPPASAGAPTTPPLLASTAAAPMPKLRPSAQCPDIEKLKEQERRLWHRFDEAIRQKDIVAATKIFEQYRTIVVEAGTELDRCGGGSGYENWASSMVTTYFGQVRHCYERLEELREQLRRESTVRT